MVFRSFRRHCRRASFLSVSMLRYGFLSVYCGLFLSLEGSVGNVSKVFCLRFRSVFGPFSARI